MVRNSPYQIVLREFTVLTVLQRLHGDFPETLQRHHRDSTETLRRYYRDSTEILHGLYRDSAETPHRLCRDSIETPQKLHRDSAETPEILQRLQRFYRDSLETLTESCNGSTTKLLGSVAGIISPVVGVSFFSAKYRQKRYHHNWGFKLESAAFQFGNGVLQDR